MLERSQDKEPEGRPLGVCVNDCQLDHGQPRSDLRATCFQLKCAFAEMRWGLEQLHESINHPASCIWSSKFDRSAHQ